MGARSERRFGDIPGVLDSVNVANFIAVISRNGYLVDAQPRLDQLNDDFGIEVKVIGVAVEWQLLKRRHRINSIPGMKLTQVCPQQPILKRSEDFIADQLIERHTALARRPSVEHSRAEHGIGSPLIERLQKLRQHLRRILAVAVKQRNEIEIVLDRIVIPYFLIAAVALVD